MQQEYNRYTLNSYNDTAVEAEMFEDLFEGMIEGMFGDCPIQKPCSDQYQLKQVAQGSV